jgi:hypothetical protein
MEKEEEKNNTEFTMDEEAQIKLLMDANALHRGVGDSITIDNKKWKLRATSQRQNALMLNLDYDVMYWQEQIKTCQTAKKAKQYNTKIRKAYAKKAAHKVLGKKLWLIPFVFALTWRRIYNCSEKVSATINATEILGENKVFYLANLGSSKQALALSMNRVGESIKQRIQRGESAENMAEQDALPKKEDNKSKAPSRGHRTTKR